VGQAQLTYSYRSASAFAFQRSSNLEKFSFPFKRGGGEIFEKMKENFSGV